jgi:glycosyltransferase involved in cell wall biosynthesis
MGGSERYVANLTSLQSKAFDVHVHTTTRYLDRVGVSRGKGVTYYRYYAPKAIWNINPLSFMLRGLIQSDPDIYHVHSYLYVSSNQAILAKLMSCKKSILQIHGGIGLPPYRTTLTKRVAKQFYDRTLGRLTIKHSDIVASVSSADLDEIELRFGIPRQNLRYLQNAVDTTMFAPSFTSLESERKTILYLGDLEPWKGVESLIHWLSPQKDWDGHKLTFRFVGQGSLMPQVLALKRKLKESDNGASIEIMGPRKHNEIPSLLQEAYALILPSFWEGMPTVVLEAMASGVPVISTRVGDIPSVIRNGKHGLLIERSRSSFQSAIHELLNNQRLARSISLNARQLVMERFSLSELGKSTSKLYTELSS